MLTYHQLNNGCSANAAILLPSKPILLTVDDGIDNFLGAATPVLRHFGYNMVAMIVTGAQNGQQPYAGFDASWTQLRQLDPSIWSFAFHAGPQGHLDFASQACPYFYPCQRPGETDGAYQERVRADVNAGVSYEQAEQRLSTFSMSPDMHVTSAEARRSLPQSHLRGAVSPRPGHDHGHKTRPPAPR